MSRPGASAAAARNLTLTEELEKLEQSITLTLQEIDHNFSKAHRIVTGSILPVVEQYGEHSKNVWEASQFWKQFFEASANVSLSGYEELANDDDDDDGDRTATTNADESTMRDEGTTAQYTPGRGNEGEQEEEEEGTAAHATPGQAGYDGEESLLDDGELTGSTPRAPKTKTPQTTFSKHESPYEALKRELKGEPPAPDADDEDDDQALGEDDEGNSSLIFAQHTARLPDMSMMPHLPKGQRSPERGAQKDPLLHRILDKNYRLQATPHKGPMLRVSPLKSAMDEKKKGKQKESIAEEDVPLWKQDSPMSSPVMEMPKLRSEAFMSPIKVANMARQRLGGAAAAGAATAGPRTPGVSVQTPLGTGKKKFDAFGAGEEEEDLEAPTQKYEIDWESDSDGDRAFEGMSPPKTIQFALPPSKLLQTPAREASKRIVDDILETAGAGPDSGEEYSPTMVKMNKDILDDSF